jgi:hypothetical protein
MDYAELEVRPVLLGEEGGAHLHPGRFTPCVPSGYRPPQPLRKGIPRAVSTSSWIRPSSRRILSPGRASCISQG